MHTHTQSRNSQMVIWHHFSCRILLAASVCVGGFLSVWLIGDDFFQHGLKLSCITFWTFCWNRCFATRVLNDMCFCWIACCWLSFVCKFSVFLVSVHRLTPDTPDSGRGHEGGSCFLCCPITTSWSQGQAQAMMWTENCKPTHVFMWDSLSAQDKWIIRFLSTACVFRIVV